MPSEINCDTEKNLIRAGEIATNCIACRIPPKTVGIIKITGRLFFNLENDFINNLFLLKEDSNIIKEFS